MRCEAEPGWHTAVEINLAGRAYLRTGLPLLIGVLCARRLPAWALWCARQGAVATAPRRGRWAVIGSLFWGTDGQSGVEGSKRTNTLTTTAEWGTAPMDGPQMAVQSPDDALARQTEWVPLAHEEGAREPSVWWPAPMLAWQAARSAA